MKKIQGEYIIFGALVLILALWGWFKVRPQTAAGNPSGSLS